MVSPIAVPSPVPAPVATWSWPLEAVQDWFLRLWDSIQRWVWAAGSRIVDWLADAGSSFWQMLYGAINSTLNMLASVQAYIVSQVSTWASWVWDKVATALFGVGGVVGSIIPLVTNAVSGAVSSIASTVTSWAGTAISSTWSGLQWLGGKISDSAVWVWQRVEDLGTFLQQQVVTPIAEGFGAMGGAIASGFGSMGRWLGDFLSSSPLINPDAPPGGLLTGPGGIFGGVSAYVGTAITAAWDSLMEMVTRLIPVSPERSPDAALSLVKLGGIAAVGLVGMTVAGEILHPLKSMGLGNLAAMIYDMMGYRAITGLILGAVLGVTLRTPLTYYFNAAARPNIPSMQQLTSLASEYALVSRERALALMATPAGLETLQAENRAEFVRLGAYAGFSDATLDRLYELTDTPERWTMLRALATMGYYDEAFATRALVNSGYSPETIRVALGALRSLAAEQVQGTGSSSALARYRDGLTDRQGLDQELLALGYAPDKLGRWGVVADLQRQTDATSEMVGAWRSSLTAQRATEAEFRDGLQQLGVQRERIDLYVLQDRVRRGALGGPGDEQTLIGRYATIATGGYRDGYVTAEELRSTLAALAYTQTEIDQLVLRARLEAGLDYSHELEAAYSSAYRRGAMTADSYDAALANLGMLPERRALVIRRDTILSTPAIKAPKPLAPPTLTLQQLTRAYKIGDITESALRERLADTDYSAADVDILVSQIRYEPPVAAAQLNLDQLRTALQTGDRTEQEVRQELARRRFSASDVDLLIVQMRAAPPPPTAQLNIGQLSTAYQLGDITEDILRVELGNRGYKTSDVGLLVSQFRLAPPPPPPTLSVSQLQSAFVRDIITEDELRAELTARQYVPDDVARLVELAVAVPDKPTPARVAELSLSELRALYAVGMIEDLALLVRLERLGYRGSDATLLLQAEMVKRAAREPGYTPLF